MKPARSHKFRILAPMVGLLFGSGCLNDRQMIFNAPRTMIEKIEKRRADRKASAAVLGKKLRIKPLPPSRGVDVPIVESN